MGRIIFCTILFVFSTVLFQKASGTLRIKRLNIISFAYYSFIIFSFVGASLVYCGFRNHYMIQKIQDDATIQKTYYIFTYTMLMFPIAIIFFNRIFLGKNAKKQYIDYITRNPQKDSYENQVFVCLCLASIIGIISCVYVFYHMGMLPQLYILKLGDKIEQTRIQITHSFKGNTYFRNLIFLDLTPMLSYLAYIYLRITHKKRWGVLFAIDFIMAVLVKTYNFEKAPNIYYLFYFCIIEILLNNRYFFRILGLISISGVIIIVMQYTVVYGYKENFFTLSSGPLGRIFMTQIATLFLHVQTFPNMHPYLQGSSLPTVLAKLIRSPESWKRSGKIVMETYNRAGVEAGTAGVMNALFVGEAYANWGIIGVIAAPAIVAFWFSIAYTWLLRTKKTPINMFVYLILFNNLTNCLNGGFVDYLYNMGIIFLIFCCYLLYIVSHKGKIGLCRPLILKRKR